MPVGSAAGPGGLGSSSLNMIRQSSLENGIKFTSGGLIANTGANNTILSNMNTNNGDRNQQDSSQKLNNKINMEAYQAYYNTNESCQAAGGGANAQQVANSDG